jgi:histidinol-phosphate/aromatic aminotransferase/cobyric acid decarboxylase-like protein
MVPEVSRGNLLVISTLTKIFALAGVRGPGFLVGSDDIARELERKAVPWRVNSVASAAGEAALRDDEYIRRTREMVPVWREEVKNGLEESGFFEAYPSEANFLLLRLLDERADGFELTEELGRKGILVRNCFNFSGLDPGFIRVAVLSAEKNAALVNAVMDVLG